MADAVEPFGQDVHEEAADELIGGERHALVSRAPVGAVVLVPEGDAVLSVTRPAARRRLLPSPKISGVGAYPPKAFSAAAGRFREAATDVAFPKPLQLLADCRPISSICRKDAERHGATFGDAELKVAQPSGGDKFGMGY